MKPHPGNTPWFMSETTCLYNHELSKVYQADKELGCDSSFFSFTIIVDLELLPFHIDLETIQKLSYLFL